MPKNKKQVALPADDGVGPSDSGEADMSSVVYIGCVRQHRYSTGCSHSSFMLALHFPTTEPDDLIWH
jgi:hypothetical protein